MFTPELITTLREGYSKDAFVRDLLAGVVVGIVAIPLALAFAIASGVPPERGLYTAIIAGFIISALGGSRVQIGGPTGAFVVIVYGVVTKYGYDGLVIATLMAGVFLIAMGLGRIGALMKFIPYPVITGFTSGIAVIIFSSQVKDFLGLDMGSVPAHFADKWKAYSSVIETFDPTTTLIGLGTLAIVVIWPRVTTKVPGPFVAMVAATVAVQALGLDVATIGSRFGAMPTMLPAPHLPTLPWEQVKELVSPAITIALLAAIESLLSAVVADGMIGTRHKSNMELVALGLSNIASVTFGGIPATGAIARTATNVKTGGRSPVAGITHAFTLLFVLVFLAKLAALIPLASLAAILVVVSYHMSEWRSFRNLFSAPRSDIAVLLVTFFLTVVVDLTVAVQVGVVLAAVLFMKRMAEVTEIQGVTDQLNDDVDLDGTLPGFRPDQLTRERIPAGVEVYEVNGPFFFGAADKLKDILDEVGKKPKVFILRMRSVPAIDATGLHALEQFAKKCQAGGSTLIISEVRSQPRRAIVRSLLYQVVGRHNFAHDFDTAIEKAKGVLDR